MVSSYRRARLASVTMDSLVPRVARRVGTLGQKEIGWLGLRLRLPIEVDTKSIVPERWGLQGRHHVEGATPSRASC